MTRLYGADQAKDRKSTWNDFTTGLQLQRCPKSEDWPAGPPMSGKEADKNIANVKLVSDMIYNDVQSGLTGQKLVHYYATLDAYADALVANVGLFQQAPPAQRRDVAREFAKTAKGFTDPATRNVYIYGDDTPAFVTIHEMMHVYTAAAHLSGNAGLGSHFAEGSADYFTRMICTKNHLEFKTAYPRELAAVEALAAEIGEFQLAALTFHNDNTATIATLDSKAAGTWKAYQKKMKSDDYPEAAGLITGAGAANTARLAREQAAADQAAADQKAKKAAAETKDRETWPPEGKSPVRARLIGREVIGDKTRLMLGIGGAHGVREGWTAHVKLSDGTAFDTKVVKVVHSTSFIDVDSKVVPALVDPIELRPKTP